MKNILYRGIFRYESNEEGERVPIAYTVTQENNGYVLWLETPDGPAFVEHTQYLLHELIEKAVVRVLAKRDQEERRAAA